MPDGGQEFEIWRHRTQFPVVAGQPITKVVVILNDFVVRHFDQVTPFLDVLTTSCLSVEIGRYVHWMDGVG